MLSTSQNTEISMSVSLLEKVSSGKDCLMGRCHCLILMSNLKGNLGLPYKKTMSQFQLKHIVKVLEELNVSEKYEKFNKWEFAETSLISHRK